MIKELSKKQHIPDKPLRFVYLVSKPFSLWVFLSFFFVLIAAGLEISTYYVFKQIIDTAEQVTTGSVLVSAMIVWVIAYPVAAAGHSLMYRASGLTAMKWMTGAGARGREILFEHMSQHSHKYFTDRFSGSLGSKIWNATDGVGDLSQTILWEYFSASVSLVSATFLVYLASPILAAIFIAWVVVLIFVSYFFAKRNKDFSLARSEKVTKLSGLFVDIFSNVTAMRQFAQRSHEVERVKGGIDELKEAHQKAWLGNETLLVVANVLMALFIISMLTGSFLLWRDNTITTGTFVLVLTLMRSFAGWFSSIGVSMNSFSRSYGSVKEGLEEITAPHDITDFPKATELKVSEGKIVFNKVGFSYGTNTVFKNFVIQIRGGERVGVVGISGSGKSTLVSLLLRQQDVHEGEVTIDGQNIRKVTQESLNHSIATVPQDSVLFHRTIRENIAYGKPDATQAEIETAAKKAQAHEFIKDLQEGYDTLVGERGVKLSGGQRQRIAIARAILKAAPILVLDEATSALDSESEVQIQNALHVLMEGKTVIAIAHRLSTLKEMDRIIVLDNGVIAQDGPHDELVKEHNGLYARLWNHQAGGFLQED